MDLIKKRGLIPGNVPKTIHQCLVMLGVHPREVYCATSYFDFKSDRKGSIYDENIDFKLWVENLYKSAVRQFPGEEQVKALNIARDRAFEIIERR